MTDLTTGEMAVLGELIRASFEALNSEEPHVTLRFFEHVHEQRQLLEGLMLRFGVAWDDRVLT